MKLLAAILGLMFVIGLSPTAGVTQAEHPLVFQRVCNIAPGQDTPALLIAEAMVALVAERYPGAQMSARSGRWMNGFQSLAEPVDQILFAEEHIDVDSYYDFTEILLADDEFQELQRQMWDLIEASTCVESRIRARP